MAALSEPVVATSAAAVAGAVRLRLGASVVSGVSHVGVARGVRCAAAVAGAQSAVLKTSVRLQAGALRAGSGGAVGRAAVRLAVGVVRAGADCLVRRVRLAADVRQIRAAGVGGLHLARSLRSARRAALASAVLPAVGSCGRFDRALEAWAELPAAWQALVVPEVGYIGRSLAALQYLRGDAVVWVPASGLVEVGGRVLIGDDGRGFVVGSYEQALAAVVRSCGTLAASIGVSACYVGSDRVTRQNAIRRAHRESVKKAAARVGHKSLSRNQSVALQAELLWRESRL